MATQHYAGETAFAHLGAEWDILAAQGMTDTPFQKLAYQRAWWTNLKPETATLHTITVRDKDEALIAIGCFYLLDQVVYFNGCVEETDYLDLIVSEENAARAWPAVLDCLASGEIGPWHALNLCNIPAASPSRELLKSLGGERGLTVIEEQIEVCPVIALPTTFEAYLDSLDSKQRREISRKLRRATAMGATTRTVGPDEDIGAATDAFLELLQASTFEKRDWLNDGRRAVFHEVARAAQADGTLQLMFTAVEGKDAAALFNFNYNGRTWVYNSGLDPAAFSGLSLGVVLTAQSIEQSIESGNSEFDFLRGDEAYKYRFGATDTAIYRLRLERPETGN